MYMFKNNLLIKVVLLLLSILNYYSVNAISLDATQQDAARSLFEACDKDNIFDRSLFDDMCNLSNYIKCSNGIIGLDFTFGGGSCTIGDLSVFSNLNSFTNDGNNDVKIDSSFFLSNLNLLDVKIKNVISFPNGEFKVRSNQLLISTNLTIPAALFNSALSLTIISSNYTQQTVSTSSFLQTLKLEINSNAKLQSDLGVYLKMVDHLTLKVYHVESGASANDFKMFDTSLFGSLSRLFLQFPPTMSYTIPSSYVNKISKLFLLYLEGSINFDNGVNLESLSLYALVMNNTILGKCSNSPCYRFPLSSIVAYDSVFDFNDIDYKDLYSLDASSTTDNYVIAPYYSTLPSIDSSFYSLAISNYSYLYGSIPDHYCKLKKVNLQYNRLNGTIPSCFKCSSKTKALILPNEFPDFNQDSLISCPNFSIDNLDKVFIASSTYNGQISVSGTDLGWSFEYENGYTALMAIPNTLAEISIPNGVGSNTRNIKIKFHDDTEITFKFKYDIPSITWYDINEQYLQFYGENFDMENSNYIQVNENTISGPQPKATLSTGSVYSQVITTDLKSSSLDFEDGEMCKAIVTSGDQVSNVFEFYYFKYLYLNYDKPIELYAGGGQLKIDGNFSSTPKISIITCKVKSQGCTINSVTKSSITITYPSLSTFVDANQYVIIDIGGKMFHIDYIVTANPTSTPTSTPTSNPSDSSDDSVSSSISIFNFNLFTLILLLIITISITKIL